MTAGQRAIQRIKGQATVQERWWGMTAYDRMMVELMAYVGAAGATVALVVLTFWGA